MKLDKSTSASSPELPWDDNAPGEVRALRRAITAHREDKPVDAELAPMMNDMLARIDTFMAPDVPEVIPAPTIRGAIPNATQMLHALTQASQSIEQLKAQESSPDRLQRLDAMLTLIKQHVAMKREVIQRVQLTDRSG